MKKSQKIQKTLTIRAVSIGAFLSLVIGIGTTYNIMVLHGSYMAIDFSTAGAIFLFFLIAFLVNAILGKIKKSFALTSGELKVIYVMMLVACALPTMGMAAQLLPIITAPFYFARPENNWAELIQPHIKQWLYPNNKLAIKYFYEGLPSWESNIPWFLWIKPLLIWGSFLIVLYFISICMMVILRRQWMEKERLVYPLAQLPIEMSERKANSLVSPLFKNKLMWLGFAIAFVNGSLIGLNYYNPAIPKFNMFQSVPIFRNSATLMFRMSFPMLGFFYLVHLDVAFSMWFFNLLSLAVRGFMKYFGYYITEDLGIYGSRSIIFAHQGMGAMIILVFSGLWIGRSHLKNVVRKAFTNDAKIDDSDEILSYPVAFWGMLIGLIFMTIWLHYTGIPLWIVPIFLFAVFVLFIGLTRIVAESGMAEAVASTIGSSFVISGFGSRILGAEGLASMGLTYVWSADIRTYVMASCASGLKVASPQRNDTNTKPCPARHLINILDAASSSVKRRVRSRMNKSQRPMFWAMMVAVVVCGVSAIWMLLRMAYLHGGINGNSWFFGGGARAPYNFIITKIVNPDDPNFTGWYIKGIGAGIMALLMFLRSRFLWWPFHPIGFAIGPIWIMDQIWATVFLAWLIKLSILRYGGLKLYRTVRPLFLGLILGQFVCNGTWLIIDLITGHHGNQIFWI